MAAARTLRVFPNPYLHVDAEGRPVAVVPVEPTNQNDVGGGYVGATLKFVKTFIAPKSNHPNVRMPQQDMQETWFEFDDEPVTVPDTIYYRRAIMSGELISADEKTSRTMCRPKHVEPSVVLGASKERARKALKDLAHEEHTDEIHAKLGEHLFGPMEGAKERRDAAAKAAKDAEEKAKAEAEKAKADADAAAKKAKADSDAAEKAAKKTTTPGAESK